MSEENRDRLVMPLNNGYNIVVEKSIDSSYPYEIFIYLEKEGDGLTQDIACVRKPYHYGKNGFPVFDNDHVELLSWEDAYSEDYTGKAKIEIYKEEEE